jgi:hypothetical protein
MIKRIQNTLLICFVLLTNSSFSQSISGNLKLLNNQEIKLEGFIGIKNYPISSTKIDENGNFTLSYSKADYGVGYLMSGDEKPLFVILSGEDIEIVGEALGYIETIKIINGKENQWFEKYAKEHPRRDQAMLLDDLNFTNSLVHWLVKVQKKESSSRHRISQKKH